MNTNNKYIYEAIPLEMLSESPWNVRKTTHKAALQEMKASILAHGLLNPLIVEKVGTGSYQVIAGNRRLHALKELRTAGSIEEFFAVPCNIIDATDSPNELSLAENIVREAMHPIDEFEAFAALADKGRKPAEIAVNFGCAEKHVLQRLKLARLDKLLLKALRDGKLSMEKAMAFTITDDNKKQVSVFKSMREWDRPEQIRQSLLGGMLRQDSPLVLYVGADAYKEAGGKYTQDLFGENIYFEDKALLETLAIKKLSKLGEKLHKDGWKWNEIVLYEAYEFKQKLTQTHEDKPPKARRALMGCVLSLNYEGKPDISYGLVKKEDTAQLRKLSGKSDLIIPASGGKTKIKGDISESLKVSLQQQRQQVMQYALLTCPDISLDVLRYAAVDSMLRRVKGYSGNNRQPGLDIAFVDNTPYELKNTPVAVRFSELEKKLTLDYRKAKNDRERFAAFRALPELDKNRLTAWAVSLTVQKTLHEENRFLEGAMMMSAVAMHAHWRPTVDNYLSRITRDQLLTIGKELFGNKFTAENASQPKGKIAQTLHDAFKTPEKYPKDIAEQLTTWLPKGMAFSFQEAAKATKKKPVKNRKAA